MSAVKRMTDEDLVRYFNDNYKGTPEHWSLNLPKLRKRLINHKVDLLIKSCEEGISGEWDCSTEEGKSSFQPMIDDLELIKRLI
jgi:hypothetical protein